MAIREQMPDGHPTLAEWPVRIWDIREIPQLFAEQAKAWMKDDFSAYDFVCAPKRRTSPNSYMYLFGYGKDRILYLKECRSPEKGKEQGRIEKAELCREQVTEAATERELLNAKIILHYQESGENKTLEFPYVPSAYYLYDPFLNWVLGLEKDFNPALAEREHPRPEKLYKESLAMFNYSLGAYRLGEGFERYQYRFQVHRHKWMPWKKILEEWLEVPMERGEFGLHSFGYLTECTYRKRKMEGRDDTRA